MATMHSGAVVAAAAAAAAGAAAGGAGSAAQQEGEQGRTNSQINEQPQLETTSQRTTRLTPFCEKQQQEVNR